MRPGLCSLFIFPHFCGTCFSMKGRDSSVERLFHIYDRIVLGLSKLAAVIAGLCILAVAFIVCYEIVMRGLFGAPTEWVLEISTYLIITAGFLGLGVTLRRRGHIQVDFVVEHLSPRVQCVLELAMTLLAVLLFLIFMTESTDFVLTSYEYNKLSPSILRFPLWIPQLSLVLGFGLLFLELIRQGWADAIALAKGDYSEFQNNPAEGRED